MTQSNATGAIDLKGLLEKSKTFITQKVTEHPMLAISISALVIIYAIKYSIYRGAKYLFDKVELKRGKERDEHKSHEKIHKMDNNTSLKNSGKYKENSKNNNLQKENNI